GPALIPLLESIVTKQSIPSQLREYAQKLVDALQGDSQPLPRQHATEVGVLIEQLTPREMEVLQLIAIGDSNQTIADKLVITVRTVKKHITNILGKLDVRNRTQAVARAHELGLITSD
ncbi:MAG: response regulator transcription factor, partial [Anaerolineae bacterium]|nr:response regulator transcription factor [Anaerolineae bacterium]